MFAKTWSWKGSTIRTIGLSLVATELVAHFRLLKQPESPDYRSDQVLEILQPRKHSLIEKDHLGDWSPEKDCCW